MLGTFVGHWSLDTRFLDRVPMAGGAANAALALVLDLVLADGGSNGRDGSSVRVVLRFRFLALIPGIFRVTWGDLIISSSCCTGLPWGDLISSSSRCTGLPWGDLISSSSRCTGLLRGDLIISSSCCTGLPSGTLGSCVIDLVMRLLASLGFSTLGTGCTLGSV